jgi:hypothetical protein
MIELSAQARASWTRFTEEKGVFVEETGPRISRMYAPHA